MNTISIRWQFDYKYGLLIAVSLIFLVSAFAQGLSELIIRWDKQEEYSHGYMIPFVSGYFIWLKKEEIRHIEFNPSWLGVLLVLMAAVLFLIGEVSGLFILIHYAFIAVLVGLAYAIMGWHALNIILVPLLFLAFSIPLPYFLEASLSANLQLWSSQMGVAFIRWCSIPVFLEGNIIDLGSYKLQVVEACSGLRYLFPLMSLGFICAYLYDTAFWQRALVFVSTLPIALLMNSFRIGVIGVVVEHWGISVAEGFLHDFEGWVIFLACIAMLFAEMAMLLKISQNSRPLSAVFGIQVEVWSDTPHCINQRTLSLPFIMAIAVLGVSVIMVQSIDTREEFMPDRLGFYQFPEDIEPWRGKQQRMEPSVVKKLGVFDYILADYVNTESESVNFYVAYYATQRKGLSPHSPKVCMPGGGWQIAGIERTNLANGLPLNRVVIKKGGQQQLVYYWFQQRGRYIANEYMMKWYLFKDALLLNRTDGALVRVSTMIYPHEQASDADRRLQSFAAKALLQLNDYIPD